MKGLVAALALALAGACGTTPPADDVPACDDYCEAILDNCVETNAQYPDRDSCERACQAFPTGTLDDDVDNTVGCRIFHAGLAAKEPVEHCPHAGPSGDGTCGTICEGFCTIAQDVCTDDLQQFADEDACLTACDDFPDPVRFVQTVTTGDSAACRLYHLTVAANDPETHCPHIVADSPVCVTR